MLDWLAPAPPRKDAVKLLNALDALTSRWQAEAADALRRASAARSDPDLTLSSISAGRARALQQCAKALNDLLIDAERDKDLPLLQQLADVRKALMLASEAGHATVLSRIGHLQAEADDHGEHSDFHNARYQRLHNQLTEILGVSGDTYDAEILDMVRERALNAWLLTVDADRPGAAPEPGSFRVGGHNPLNIWLDPDRDRSTSKQVLTMFTEAYAAELVRSLNLFPAAPLYTSGPAHRGGRIVYLNGREIGAARTAEWAQKAVDAMNAHYLSEKVAQRAETPTDETSASRGPRYQTRPSDYGGANVKIIDTQSTRWPPGSGINHKVFSTPSDECPAIVGAAACLLLNVGSSMPLADAEVDRLARFIESVSKPAKSRPQTGQENSE